jgi:hypothetical protein
VTLRFGRARADEAVARCAQPTALACHRVRRTEQGATFRLGDTTKERRSRVLGTKVAPTDWRPPERPSYPGLG